MKKVLIIMAVLPVIFLGACSVDSPEHPDDLKQVWGYMSLGNSLTAGFMDSGLYMPGQLGSFPRLIAGQMGIDTTFGGSDFTQPYVGFPGLGSSDPDTPGNIAGVLYYDGNGVDILGETPMQDVPQLLLASSVPTPYHNLAVPGAFLIDVMHAFNIGSGHGASIGQPNPFFLFINRVPVLFPNNSVEGPPAYESGSMFGQAVAKGAGIVTLWIGNNDVLGGATEGSPVIGENITDPGVFSAQYNTLLQALAEALVQRNGVPSTIVVGNIPSITDIPYFMTVQQFETAMGGTWEPGYEEDGSASGMLVTLPALSYGADHPDDPLPANYTLNHPEVTTVGNAVTAFNATISNAVATINQLYPGSCALFDANTMMAELPQERKTHFLFALDDPANEGDPALAAASTYFSLDGVHPNQKGYGMIANAFLVEINRLRGTSYPPVNLDDLTWDPLYGQEIVPVSGGKGGFHLSRAAGNALQNMAP